LRREFRRAGGWVQSWNLAGGIPSADFTDGRRLFFICENQKNPRTLFGEGRTVLNTFFRSVITTGEQAVNNLLKKF
jgi:hypothetical protein